MIIKKRKSFSLIRSEEISQNTEGRGYTVSLFFIVPLNMAFPF